MYLYTNNINLYCKKLQTKSIVLNALLIQYHNIIRLK